MSFLEESEFTIVIIDDDLPAVESEITEVKRYLTSKGITKQKIIEIENGDTIEEILNQNHVNMVFTDKTIRDSEEGLRIVEKTRNHSDLIDILLYSAKGVEYNDYKQLSHYTAVQVFDDKLFADTAKTLIERSLSKWEDIIFLRGMLISYTVDMELKMDEFFTKYFRVEERATKFFNLMLDGITMPFSKKRQFLVEITKETTWDDPDKIKNHLMDIEFERNILAHAEYDPDNNQFISRAYGDQIFDKERLDKTLRKINEVSRAVNTFSSKVDDMDSV